MFYVLFLCFDIINMNVKKKILNTYNQLVNIYGQLNKISCLEFKDEYFMFASIYLHYDFKDNGCPYYDINQVNFQIPIDIDIDIYFEPKYNLFLQDMYDIIFDWVFGYKVKSTKIKKLNLNIKININTIQFEIYSNKTINELINLIAEYYNFRSINATIKKNNMQLINTNKLIEYKLDNTSKLTLYINQFS